ncbi:aldo/keto reductase [Henriciella aquimarina]|uniref:aldo/keto reductase n=1 Tax=Henriciella aquimarina TaxID=545261 RepID=UPI000A000F8A|nr:aldo/keto reductase [Henriciella aquimarina]
MQKRTLGRTGAEIAPLVLGGNVFGWTADQATSFNLLDAFLDHGFNAVDSANIYTRFIPGNEGGESETVIGNWLADRKRRDDLFLITKVGGDMGDGKKGLSADQIVARCEESLKRLKTDHIDLYFSHFPDPETPIEETLEAHDQLVKAGKVRFVGGSNYDAAGLKAALDAGEASDRASYDVLQPHYNLMTREEYEGPLEDLCLDWDLGVIPYFALAMGFLTGKYKSEADLDKSPRGRRMKDWFTDRNMALLDLMEEVAHAHDATMAQVALAWLMARPSVTAPIASATRMAQLEDIMAAAELRLSAEEMNKLNAA